MEAQMATVVAHNIISPLGFTSEMNYHAIKCGNSSLCFYERAFGTSLSVMASMFDEAIRKQLQIEGFTWFESLVIHSVRKAIADIGMDVSGKEVCFVLSTTKANVESLDTISDEQVLPGRTAEKIARYLGFVNEPLVVCNACISGVSALIAASRLIDAGFYRHVVVCGCDVLGKFIVSGFESLKALSPDECRPFDEERIGLNLGEAAATVVLSASKGKWHICRGAVCNDAYHISTPSPKGIGSGMALAKVLGNEKEELAFINLHGTATLYNDQMEWKALERSHLTDVPANALKGYLGHTMGAAGVMECIISMLSADDGVILGTRGFHASGVSGVINMSSHNRSSDKDAFVKLISGFGGCNAAVFFTGKAEEDNRVLHLPDYTTISKVILSSQEIWINENRLPMVERGKNLIVELYKRSMGDYPRFYKMDGLSRLGLVAAELLFQSVPDFDSYEQTAIVLFNHSSSLCADKKYLASISGENNFFPSPSAFVYTLPNIVNGEIALRHGMHSETSFYILPERDEKMMGQLVSSTLADENLSYCLTGWLEYMGDDDFIADIRLIKKVN